LGADQKQAGEVKLAQYRATTAAAFRAGQREGSIGPELDVEVETERMITDGLGLASGGPLNPIG